VNSSPPITSGNDAAATVRQLVGGIGSQQTNAKVAEVAAGLLALTSPVVTVVDELAPMPGRLPVEWDSERREVWSAPADPTPVAWSAL
jgi:hypothetical protein